MRFKFCGDLDAPDWLLSNIAILSNLSSDQFKDLSVAVINELMESDEFNYDKVLDRTQSLNGISEVKSAIASILFIISNSARFNVNEQQLSVELQQIGLPKDSTEVLCKSYKSIKIELVQHLKTKTVRLPKIDELKWRVDFVLSSSKLKQVNQPSVQLELKIVQKEHQQTQAFDISLEQFRVLHYELATARKLMEQLQ